MQQLSDYWKAFKAAGFSVDEFEKPRITPERYHLAENDQKLLNSKTRSYSVVFKLQKVKIIRNKWLCKIKYILRLLRSSQ